MIGSFLAETLSSDDLTFKGPGIRAHQTLTPPFFSFLASIAVWFFLNVVIFNSLSMKLMCAAVFLVYSSVDGLFLISFVFSESDVSLFQSVIVAFYVYPVL